MDTATDEFDKAFAAIMAGELESRPRDEQGPIVPAPRHEIQSISHVHEAIMNYMLTFPQHNLGQCAAHFGYSRSWLSTLIHSDLFQARLKEKQDILFSSVQVDIATKLGALADVSIEKLQEHAESSTDPKFLLEASKMALAGLGFGAKGNVPVNQVNAQNVQQVFVASPADLEAARGMILNRAKLSSPETTVQLPDDATPQLGN